MLKITSRHATLLYFLHIFWSFSKLPIPSLLNLFTSAPFKLFHFGSSFVPILMERTFITFYQWMWITMEQAKWQWKRQKAFNGKNYPCACMWIKKNVLPLLTLHERPCAFLQARVKFYGYKIFSRLSFSCAHWNIPSSVIKMIHAKELADEKRGLCEVKTKLMLTCMNRCMLSLLSAD